jgi:hypothetical protein
VTGQLELLDTPDLCAYGQPKLGEPRPCSRPATHAARWYTPPTYGDGIPNSRAGAGGIRCCLDHANYYARGWLGPVLMYPAMRDAVWLEVLR